MTKTKIITKTKFVLMDRTRNVKSANPQTIRYRAMTALNPLESEPAGLPSVEEYGASRFNVGSCNMPKLNQNTASTPQAIMGKKLPMIHSKTQVSSRSTGPTKKKIPLKKSVIELPPSSTNLQSPYTTGVSPFAPPQPIMTIEKVIAEITNLNDVVRQTGYHTGDAVETYPANPRGVGLAKRLILSPARGTLGVRYS